MYLFSQMATTLFIAFLLGVGVGYALWRTLGQREVVARFNAAEMRLAAHMARWEKAATATAPTPRSAERAPFVPPTAPRRDEQNAVNLEKRWEEAARRELDEFEAKQSALLKEAEVEAIRKAEAAAEKKFADLAGRLGVGAGYAAPVAEGALPPDPTLPTDPTVVQLPETQANSSGMGTVTRLRTAAD